MTSSIPTATASTPLVGGNTTAETSTASSIFLVDYRDADRVTENNYQWILLLGILNIVGGILAFAMPALAATVAVSIIGWTLILVGVFCLMGTCVGEPGTRAYYALLGTLQLLLGFLMLSDPFNTLTFIGIFISLKVVVDGMVMLFLCFTNRQIKGWFLFLTAGLCSVVFGLYVLVNIPNGSAIVLIGIVVGANLLTAGILKVFLACQGPSVADTEHSTDANEIV